MKFPSKIAAFLAQVFYYVLLLSLVITPPLSLETNDDNSSLRIYRYYCDAVTAKIPPSRHQPTTYLRHQKNAHNYGDNNNQHHQRHLVVGGETAPEGHLYMVYLDLTSITSSSNVGRDRCGGVLISPTKVLTSAHCMYSHINNPIDTTPGPFTLQVSQYDTSQTNPVLWTVEQYTINPSVDILYHPNFIEANIGEPQNGGDFALITLSTPLNSLGVVTYPPSQITPIKINQCSTLPTNGQELTILGWGVSYQDASPPVTPHILQEGTVNAVSQATCQTSWNAASGGQTIGDDMLCANSFSAGACVGDSGGPLFIKGASPGEDILVGLTSFGSPVCVDPQFPTVYSRISYAYPWIVENVDDLPTQPSCIGDDDDGDEIEDDGEEDENENENEGEDDEDEDEDEGEGEGEDEDEGELVIGKKFQGCDQIDNNHNGLVDECEEDTVRPTISLANDINADPSSSSSFLPWSSSENMGGRCTGTFVNEKYAYQYLMISLVVEDDCFGNVYEHMEITKNKKVKGQVTYTVKVSDPRGCQTPYSSAERSFTFYLMTKNTASSTNPTTSSTNTATDSSTTTNQEPWTPGFGGSGNISFMGPKKKRHKKNTGTE